MNSLPRLSGRALALPLAVLLLPVVAGSAAAARPNVAVTADEPRDTDVSIGIAVNRGAKQIASCTYVVDSGASAGCGSPTSEGSKRTGYTVNLTDQEAGEHTVTVTLTLTDGGSRSGSASFTVAAAHHVFARAFTNADGLPGYDPATDVLLTELVDTNDNDIIDAGDTIGTYAYPLDLAASAFGTFAVSSHDVRFAITQTPNRVEVAAGESGGDDFTWSRELAEFEGYEIYVESTPLEPDFSGFADSHLTNSGVCDSIRMDPGSPSQPTFVRDFGECDGEDDPFVDIEINLPS